MQNGSVFVYLDLYHILSVNEREGYVTVKMWLFFFYFSLSSQWNVSQTGIACMIVPQDTFWCPDIGSGVRKKWPLLLENFVNLFSGRSFRLFRTLSKVKNGHIYQNFVAPLASLCVENYNFFGYILIVKEVLNEASKLFFLEYIKFFTN